MPFKNEFIYVSLIAILSLGFGIANNLLRPSEGSPATKRLCFLGAPELPQKSAPGTQK